MVRVCCDTCVTPEVCRSVRMAVRLAWCGSAAPIARAQAHVFPTEQYIAESSTSNRASFTFRWFPLPSRALAGSSLAETEMDDAQATAGVPGSALARGVDRGADQSVSKK